MNIGILGASPDNRNLGVGALAYGILHAIAATFKEEELTIIFFVPWGSTYERNIHIHEKCITIKVSDYGFRYRKKVKRNLPLNIFLTLLLSMVPIKKLKSFILSRQPLLSDLNSCEFVADIYGGDSFTDAYGLFSFLKSWALRVFVLLNKKVYVLLPQTYGPYRNVVSRACARMLIKHSRLMFSRDHMSIESIRQLWKKNETVPIVNHSPDVAFLIEYEDAYDRAFEHWIKAQYAGQTTVGINASGLLYSEWNSGRNRFGLRKSYEHTILTLCEALLERGHRLILIPHVYNHPVDWDNPSPENDLVILTRLYEKLHTAYGNNVFLVECNYSPAEIRRFIKQCDFFIGTRMHSCIASMSFHIPTVALAYSDKYSGVFSSLGVLESVFDLRKSSNGTMVHDILQLIDSREATRTILETGVPLTKAKIYSAFKEISNLIH